MLTFSLLMTVYLWQYAFFINSYFLPHKTYMVTIVKVKKKKKHKEKEKDKDMGLSYTYG